MERACVNRKSVVSASPNNSSRKTWDSAAAEERTKFFNDFSYIVKHALRLETVHPGVYRSKQLWTPAGQKTVYGGQLIAHVVEAAYRTVDAQRMHIHSLRVSFISAGDSRPHCGPIEYSVERLRDGRSFALRQVRATQQNRTLLLAVAGFHRAEQPGIRHELALPSFVKDAPRGATVAEVFARRLNTLCGASQESASSDAQGTGARVDKDTDAVASIQYLNLAAAGAGSGVVKSATPNDVWARLTPEAFALLSRESGIPSTRIHLIVACWLSDFIVALASLLPHGLPNPNLRMIASLDHSIYFHNPQRVKVDDWFAYEVRSSWAGNNRGLNHGRMYGRDGRLWMSVAQETVIRMKQGYLSKL